MHRHRLACLGAAGLALASVGPTLGLGGCSTTQRWQLGVPGTTFDFRVTSVEPRDALLDVSLRSDDGLALRSFVPASPACAELFEAEANVAFLQGGSGTFRRGELECRAAGIGSLDAWRDRRRETPDLLGSPVPSAQADYDVVYRDTEVAFLRGRFPLAERLGWTGLGDTIAVVPTEREACRQVLDREVATLEYFARGTPVLALMGAEARCPIVGLIRPPGSRAEAGTP